MGFLSSLQRWLGRKPSPYKKKPNTLRLNVELLEERLAPAAGDLDPAFGALGVVRHDMRLPGASDYGGYAAGLDRLSNGKIIVAATGTTQPVVYLGGGTYAAYRSDLILMRLHTNGGLDTSFGFDRHGANTSIRYLSATAADVMVQPGDDMILVAGTGDMNAAGNGAGSKKPVLWRFTGNGVLDSGFGTGGIATPDFGSGSHYGVAVARQPDDGKILFLVSENSSPTSRFLLMRLNVNGTPDMTFGGGDGIAEASFGVGVTPTAMVATHIGAVVVGATNATYPSTDQDIAIARFRSNGTLDTDFSGDGLHITALSLGRDVPTSVRLSESGYPLLVGAYTVTAAGGTDFAMLCYNADGSFNSSFGSTSPGQTVTAVSAASGTDYPAEVLALPSGTLFQVGSTPVTINSSTVHYPALTRFSSTGVLDTDFSVGGKRIHNAAPQKMDFGLADAMLLPGGQVVTLGIQGGDVVVMQFLGFNSSTLDIGDAPDTYGTKVSSNGARHTAGGPMLGTLRDTEEDDAIVLNGFGDDSYLKDDEDGVKTTLAFGPGQSPTLSIQVTGGSAKLDAWIDFDRNGVFHPTNERITAAAGTAMSEGLNSLTFTVPGSMPNSSTYARFRLSTAGGLTPTGVSADGEVEDYIVNIGIPPRVDRISPDLTAALQNTVKSITMSFSMQVNQAGEDSSYILRTAGPDGRLGTGDDVNVPFSLQEELSFLRYRLQFSSPLAEGFYRLTIKDALFNPSGILLDGDGDGGPGGNYVRDFIVGAGAAHFTSADSFTFHPQVTGANAGELAGNHFDIFNGFGRLTVGGQAYAPTAPTSPSSEVIEITTTNSSALPLQSYEAVSGLTFTASQAGVYQLSTYLHLENFTTSGYGHGAARYAINGTPISTRRYAATGSGNNTPGQRRTLWLQEYLTLQAGDVITVQARSSGGDMRFTSAGSPHLLRVTRYPAASFGEAPAVWVSVASTDQTVSFNSTPGNAINGLSRTVPTSGWYRLSSTLVTSGNNVFSAGFRISGVGVARRGTEQNFSASEFKKTMTVEDCLYLNAGDVVEAVVYNSNTTNLFSLSDDQVLRVTRLAEAPHLDPVTTTITQGTNFQATYQNLLQNAYVAPATGLYRIGLTARTYQSTSGLNTGRLRFVMNGQPYGGQHEYLFAGEDIALEVEQWFQLEEGDTVQIQGKSDTGVVQFKGNPNSLVASHLRVTPVGTFANPTVDAVNQELTTPAQSVAGLTVKREVYAPPTGAHSFARTVDVFTNPGVANVTRTIRLDGNLGYTVANPVFLTSDGDVVVETTDEWIGLDDADGSGLPAMILFLNGPLGIRPTSFNVAGDNVFWEHSLSVAPGETARLAYFTIVATSRDEAIAATAAMATRTGFTAKAGDQLTSAERSSIKNWVFYNTPTDITLSNSAVNENRAAGSEVGFLAAVDADQDSFHSFDLVSGTGGQDNDAFVIDGITLLTNTSFDYESKSSYNVRIRATDQDGLSVEKALVITIANVNDAPNDITLSTSSVDENLPAATVVGTLGAVDQDSGNTFTFALVAGAGDNSRFTLTGDTLKTASVLNFEAQSSYNVRVRATDQGGLSFERVLVVLANDRNDAPTAITLSNATIAENLPAATVVGNLGAVDPDAGASHTFALISSGPTSDTAKFAIVGGQLKTAVTFDFEAKSVYNVEIRATDQAGLAFEQTLVVQVANVNEAPTLPSLSNTSIVENLPIGAEVGVLSSTDQDVGNNLTYTLVSGDGATDNARFAIVGNSLRTADLIDFEAGSTLSIRIRVSDGSNPVEKSFVIQVTDTNDAPILNSAVEPALPQIDVSQPVNVGILVHDLIVDAAGLMTDQDVGALQGIVVVASSAANGKWQYSVNNGTTWLNLGAASPTAARLLAADALTRVRFLPSGTFSGNAALGIKAWDRTAGINATTANTNLAGGPRCFSTSSTNAKVIILGVNNAPVQPTTDVPLPAISRSNTNPPGTIVADLLAGATDFEGAGTLGVAVIGSTGIGTWQYSTDSGTSWISFGTVSPSVARLLPRTDQVRFVPAAAFNGVASLSFRAWDRTTGTQGATANLSLAGSFGGATAYSNAIRRMTILVNDAPTLGTAPDLTGINEDTTNPAGSLVSALIPVGVFADSDPAPLKGIAVFGVTGTGTWQYSTNGGTVWIALGTISVSSALLLNDSHKIRFVPGPNWNETATLTYRAWDRTEGTAGAKVNLSAGPAVGGNTPFSADSATTNLEVAPINDAPIQPTNDVALPAISRANTNPSGTEVLALLAAATDVDGDNPTGIAVIAATGTGIWQYSADAGATWINFGSLSSVNARLLQSAHQVRFVPNSSVNAIASLSYRAWDQTSGTPGSLVNLSTAPTIGGATGYSTAVRLATVLVNDAPTLGTAPNLTVINEDTKQPQGDLVSTLVPVGVFADSDPAPLKGIAVIGVTGTGTWQFSTNGGTTWGAMGTIQASSALLLLDTHKVRFVPALDWNGTATLTYRAWDRTQGTAGAKVDLSSGSAVGGNSSFSATSATANLAVAAVNDAPVQPATDVPLPSIGRSNSNPTGTAVLDILGGANDVEGALLGIAVIGSTGTGAWQYSSDNGATWINFGSTSSASARLLLRTDQVRFVPNVSFTGVAKLTFRAWDRTTGTAGGTANLTAVGGTSAYSNAFRAVTILITDS